MLHLTTSSHPVSLGVERKTTATLITTDHVTVVYSIYASAPLPLQALKNFRC